ncbi:MAG TPA: phosphoenolpyruvate carboxykinase (GTP) [Alphaproteobacteria bacterium]|nr:phosphoenolpyruvate carboxykinase (GTP) [Alphaproteobacteria bacterium]
MATPVEQWVDEVAQMTRPAKVVWCDGSDAEYQGLIEGMLDDGTLLQLNQRTYPNCYLHRSHPSDVARTEHLTFICTPQQEDAGPTNNWMSPPEARDKVGTLFQGSMQGRTMYVVPYIMGPVASPYSKVGVEVTDSPYVAASMRIMTRMGQVALDRLGSSADFVPGLHSIGDLSPERRFILHFPEERLIWSVGSGYGGNALLGKKCFALRIASVMGRDEGWMAEHMLILGLEDPTGEVTYMAAAFPSACGKTNLAMLVSPLAHLGYKVWTVGEDICWMQKGPDGRLWAINPEAGFFGVAPGTSSKTNPNIMATIRHDTIFTNVALTPSGEPWWEGMDGPVPQHLTDWRGQAWTPGKDKAAHPNSRFTTPAQQCPSISPHWEDPQGVPISAIIFGGRRARVAPLVYQAFNWQHGVFVGASMASETTAAATGAVGVVRHDPMAMLPFCGYNMADYFRHWLAMGRSIPHPPQIFHVNWFRTDAQGNFLWPGFGQNVRVLKWILERVRGGGKATETPIGYVPTVDGIEREGLDLRLSTLEELLRIERTDWEQEVASQRQFFEKFGSRLPREIQAEHEQLAQRLHRVSVGMPQGATPGGR